MEYEAYVPAAVLQLVLFVLSVVLAARASSARPSARRLGASAHTPIPAEFAASRTFY